jgi:voltage-gated potassium channel
MEQISGQVSLLVYLIERMKLLLGSWLSECQSALVDPRVLLQVEIAKARCTIAALPSDAENLYTILSAKTLPPSIRTIIKASTEETVQKFQRGDVNFIASSCITGGKRMAKVI